MTDKPKILKDQRIPVMMSMGEVRVIDMWRKQQPDFQSRSEAIRRLVMAGICAPTS